LLLQQDTAWLSQVSRSLSHATPQQQLNFTITDEGDVWAWGCNKDQQLGSEESFEVPYTPRKVTALQPHHVLKVTHSLPLTYPLLTSPPPSPLNPSQLACGKDHSVVLIDIPIHIISKKAPTTPIPVEKPTETTTTFAS